MTPQDFYKTQSPFSDPGAYAYLFDQLPDDLPAMCRVVQTTYRHYYECKKIPQLQPRMTEVNTRYVSDILARMLALDPRPLTEERPLEKRFIGCCRDAALLLCAMLRHKGVPARTRVGFAAYIRLPNVTDFYVDHVVTEYWDDGRWKLSDPEQSMELIAHNNIAFDVLDIPRDQFVIGGQAWQMCREKRAKPDSFGGHPRDQFKGWWALRNRLVHDLATLNKVEMLLWDDWGWTDMRIKLAASDQKQLDKLAEFTQQGDEIFEKLQLIYQGDTRFRAPRTVMSYSPSQPPQRVTLKS